MSEPPPRDPHDPADDETIIADSWGPDDTVIVEQEEVVEEPPRRLPELWPWLLALLLLVLVGLAAAYFLTRDDEEGSATTAATTTAATTTAAEQVTVPDVVGTTSSEATATLQNAGLEVNLVSVPSDRAPGTVVAQSPAAGTEQPEGTSVRLNVAEEAGTTTQATTEQTTTEQTTTEETTTTAPPPTPQPATVPDVVGQELADAARSFADEQLKASVVYVPSQEPAGSVVAQAQPAGASRPRGSNVQLNVSAGPDAGPRSPVPGVTGQSLEEARAALEAAGFEVLALALGDGDVRNESTIASQSPVGGATAPSGALVLLYV